MKYKKGDKVIPKGTDLLCEITDVNRNMKYPYYVVTVDNDGNRMEGEFTEESLIPASSDKGEDNGFNLGDRVCFQDTNGILRVGHIIKIRDKAGTEIIDVMSNKEIHRIIGRDKLDYAGNLVDPDESAEEFAKKLEDGFFDEMSWDSSWKCSKVKDDAEDIAYRKGLHDAWELAFRLSRMEFSEIQGLYGFDGMHRDDIFNTLAVEEVLERYNAMTKYKKI